jgi:prefoldin subunit 5
MSNLDRLTDRGLQDLIGLKDQEIFFLRQRIKDLEEALKRSNDLCTAKSKRITSLSLDLHEAINKEHARRSL